MRIKRKIHVFDIFNTLFMLLIILVTAYPMYYVVIASFSDPTALMKFRGILWKPLEPFTTDAYKAVFSNVQIATGLKNTIVILIVGVTVNMLLTILGAYFLSVKGPMLKNVVAYMIIFTMYFSGGLVPGYLNVKDLGLLNTTWSLILPGAINTTNLIIMKSAFQSIPDSLLESAQLDGAKPYQILTRIIVPLSKATIAVIALYYIVGHWNAWFNASIYIKDKALYPLQLVMHQILSQSQAGSMTGNIAGDEVAQYVELIKYALIVVTTVPILVVYPYLQKYFVKGVMVGAVKG